MEKLVKSNAFAEKENIPYEKKEESIQLEKQKYIFYKFVAEITGKIEKLHESIDFENLTYYFKSSTEDIDFNDFIDAETLLDNIKLKNIRFEDAEKNHKEFKSKLSSAKIGGKKSDEQLIQ